MLAEAPAVGHYSDTLMEHFLAPRNSGPMENPDLLGLAGVPGEGPFLLLELRLSRDRIAAAKFQTHGCGASIAAGSMLTTMIIGETVNYCHAMTAEQLAEALGGVPPDKLHCPALAVGALHAALEKYQPAPSA